MNSQLPQTPFFRRNPLWFRALNTAWQWTYPAGTRIELRRDDLISRARKLTGIHDLGAEFDPGPLDRLLESVNGEANLHPAGRFIARERFTSLLAIRLRAEEIFRKHPQILEQELLPAWFIIGLQRTGTTKLQRLLATDPAHRVIPSWEVINPVPLKSGLYDLSAPGPPVPYPSGQDRRPAIARTSVKAVRYLSPGFFAVHPIDPVQPEEDILLLDVSFMSTTPEATMHVPSYAAWLERTDQSDAYAYSVRLLKLLQWIRPARRWVLKSPHHLEFLPVIRKHFPGVHFLWPHRDPAESIPSFLSMVVFNRMIFSNRVDPDTVAAHWVRKIGYMLNRAMEFRTLPGNDPLFTDIFFRNLVTDSIGELRKIYRLDGGLTPERIEAFRKHEREHPRDKHGVHQYDMADFGLTEEAIRNHTKAYGDFLKETYGRPQAE